MTRTFSTINTSLGDLTLTASEDLVTGLYQDGQPNFPEKETLGEHVGAIAFEDVAVQLDEYLHGLRKRFLVPILHHGTAFQRYVWKTVEEIPYGETVTYGELARMMDEEKSVRAVATAVAKNPLTVIVPCHRVVAASGEEKYSGGIPNKRLLLELESQYR